MAITNRNKALLHRKEFQMMTPAPVATSAGVFMIASQADLFNVAMYVSSATVHYLYHHDEDSYTQIPSGALAGTFGAGACGVFHPWSINYTANGGSTTTITVAAGTHNLTGLVKNQTVEFISSGINNGLRRTITSILTDIGAGTITLTLNSSVPTAVLNTHTFRISSGRFYVLCPGTLAAGSWKVFDVGTLAWQANLVITNLPATWGTDGKITHAYRIGNPHVTGTATAGDATTLTNGAKAWTTNQWTNSQVRITGGTGIGQVRNIASNTGTVLTVSSAWTTNPDVTSTYEIEGNEDFLYLLGNNAITMYRYSISANTWTVMAPTVARAAAPVLGMSADVAQDTGDDDWDNENNIKDCRYIYSMRGGAGALIDRFDIAGGTAGAGAWAAVTYVGAEVFGAGSSASISGCYLYIRKDATNRFFKYSITGNSLEPLAVNLYTDSTGVAGNKIWVKKLDSTGSVIWLYALGNTLTTLHRLMLF